MNTFSLAAMFGQAWLWPLVLQARGWPTRWSKYDVSALGPLSCRVNGRVRGRVNTPACRSVSRITSRGPCSRGPPTHSATQMRRFGTRFPTGPPQGQPPGTAPLKTLTAESVCIRCKHRASPNDLQHLPAFLACRNDLGTPPLILSTQPNS
jgi:hypothetical protein